MAPRDRLFALEQFGIKLGLDNITRLLDALGHPERAWPSVHVAGTNGKGSVTAMVERGLRAAGHRTGRYTSPHLSHIEERIAIDGTAVTADVFDAMADDALRVVDRLRHDGVLEASPTFFEVTTAMAFELFRRASVSVAVIEVGLGGRFDSTNVITPAVSVITSVAMDHERHLGHSIGEIAFEKAGIIKPGVPVVVGDVPPEAASVIRNIAESHHAPIISAGDQDVQIHSLHNGRAHLTLRTPHGSYGPLTIALAGAHQARNAVVAARTLEMCQARGLPVTARDVVTALTDVHWPARLEWLALDDRRRILLDAAHNPAGIAALADYLRSAGVAPLPVVVAIMRDKDVAAMLDALGAIASRLIATEVPSTRSLPARDLAEHAHRVNPALAIEACPDWHAAIERALTDTDRAVVAGSIFLVGPLRAELLAKGARTVAEGR